MHAYNHIKCRMSTVGHRPPRSQYMKCLKNMTENNWANFHDQNRTNYFQNFGWCSKNDFFPAEIKQGLVTF